MTNIALYGNTCKLTLPLKSIEEEFKVLCAREVLQYRESADPKVSGAGVAVKIGYATESWWEQWPEEGLV